MNDTTSAEAPSAKYARWARIFVSVLSFGMIFPNAITDGMERTQLPPYVVDDADDKKR